MARVTGIGGVFFKSHDPAGLKTWYTQHLGFEPEEGSEAVVLFKWRDARNPAQEGFTVWSAFPDDTTYFEPTCAPYMIRYIMDDLDGMLRHLRTAGVQVDERVDDTEYGRFGWAVAPEGVRFELWQPPAPEA